MSRDLPAVASRRSLAFVVLLALVLALPVSSGSASALVGKASGPLLNGPNGPFYGTSSPDPPRSGPNALGGPLGPTPSIASAAPRPAATGVDPLLSYAREPAPMGVADYGVTSAGSGARVYAYSSSSFVASALVGSMNVSAATVAFELNAVLLLQAGGTNYSYWIQNGLHLDDPSDRYTIGGAYVWNFSASGAHLGPGEVQGANGSVLSTGPYYYIPNCNSLPGQCATVSLPVTLEGRVNASVVGGVPAVSYSYNLGAGWVTYDTVRFLHLAGATIQGFHVDGRHATPYSSRLYYDTEWTWGAAGGGSTMTDRSSDITMALTYWNGHDYQNVPSAWDFGANTAETASNVTVALAAPGPGGALAGLLASGPGSLGVLYNDTDRGFLNVSSGAVPNGTLLIGGQPVPFQGGAANLSLSPGSYALSLLDYSNASNRVTIVAGATTSVDLSGAGRTTFEASGLSPGTSWGLTVGSFTRTTSTSSLTFALANGTYGIQYDRVPGFVRAPSDPSAIAVPASGTIVLTWTAFMFDVPVTEAGLPTGTSWWVNASGQLVAGSTPTLDVQAPNGTTPYEVGSLYEFLPTPESGTIVISSGLVAPVLIQFGYRPSYLVGTVQPGNASLTIDGSAVSVVGGEYNSTVLPGTHTIVASAPGYTSQTLQAVATPGNATNTSIVLVKAPGSPPPSGSGNGPTSSSVPSTTILVGLVAVAAVVVGVVALVLARRRSPPVG